MVKKDILMNEAENKKCPKCGFGLRKFKFKLISTNNSNPIWPKYTLQIKELCANCGGYIRFAPQTPELTELFNQNFAEREIVEPG